MNLKARHYALLGLSLAITSLFLGLFLSQRSPCVFSLAPANPSYARPAHFWKKADMGVQCRLCPFNCFLPEGAKGKCRVRMNKDGKLYTEVYGQAVSINVDPIEKKPVFHMLPGSRILSLATVGCPLRCTFCQNWSLSQSFPEEVKSTQLTSPEDIVKAALAYHIPSIAYTYSEPVIFYEYMLETARLAKQNGLRNVMVTSGYINPEPLAALAPYFDVIKVDLKGMDEKFYRDDVGGRLDAVLTSLKLLKKLNVLTEVVNLVVPGRNDSAGDFEKLSQWVYDNLGPDTPLFFSRFHPDYKLSNLPPTPIETLEQARNIAMKIGLRFVYLGNVPGSDGENTYCPHCHALLVKRVGYDIQQNNLKHGRCPVCGTKIPGIWD